MCFVRRAFCKLPPYQFVCNKTVSLWRCGLHGFSREYYSCRDRDMMGTLEIIQGALITTDRTL